MKLILVIGILARLLMLALFDPNPLLTSGDAPLFITQHGFGLEPPGYPLFLAFLFPLGPWAVILVQMALTISVALFTYARTKLLWLALAIVACPYFIIFELKIYTEALVCALVWVALVLLCWPRHKWEPALAGLLLGLATLTRDTLYLMPLLIPIFAIRTKLFKPALIACLTAFLIVLPWQIVHGGKISEGRGGSALWIGTWETNPAWMLGGLTNWPEKHPDLLAAWQRHDDAPFTKAAIEKMRAEPLTVIKTWAVRYPRLWIGTRTDALQMRIDRHAIAWFALKAFFFTLNLAILFLALIGMWRLSNDPRSQVLAVPVIYLGIILIPFHNVEPRYTLPAMIPLLWFAGHAATAFTTAKLNVSASDNDPPLRFSSATTNEPPETLSIQ